MKKKTGEFNPTHKQLVRRMSLYYKNRLRSIVVMTEFVTYAGEIPDIVAWTSGHICNVIEVKVSRQDFLKDGDKFFRKCAECGIGTYRYFAAPKGLIKPEELPENLGLYELTDKQCFMTVEAKTQDSDKGKEVIMLVSAIRRLEISTAVFVRQENEEIMQDCYLI